MKRELYVSSYQLATALHEPTDAAQGGLAGCFQPLRAQLDHSQSELKSLVQSSKQSCVKTRGQGFDSTWHAVLSSSECIASLCLAKLFSVCAALVSRCSGWRSLEVHGVVIGIKKNEIMIDGVEGRLRGGSRRVAST